jgi:acyl carrier protein
MIINSVKELQDKLISKPGYFDSILEKFSIKLDEIKPDNSTWYSVGMGGLDCVEMIMDFEKDLDIQIPDELLNTIENWNFYEFYKSVSIAKIRQDKLNQLGI